MSRSHKPRNRLPIEADYIPLARRVLTAQSLRERAHADEIQAKRECATRMHASNVTSFEFRQGDGKTYKAALDRPSATMVNVRKLYTLLGNGEITLDQFFDCVVASEQAVIDTLGEEEFNRVKETYVKGLDLVIKEV